MPSLTASRTMSGLQSIVHIIEHIIVYFCFFCRFCFDHIYFYFYYIQYISTTRQKTSLAHFHQSLPWSTKLKHLDPNCNNGDQACQKSSQRRTYPREGNINHVFKASENDFEIVIRNGNRFFQSGDRLQFWKCEYGSRFPWFGEEWRCVEEGMMVAAFQMDGHFNYDESNQATKMKFVEDQRRILFEKYHIPKVVYTIIEQTIFWTILLSICYIIVICDTRTETLLARCLLLMLTLSLATALTG